MRSGATRNVGETLAAAPHSLLSLGLEVKFRPTESLRNKKAGCAFDTIYALGKIPEAGTI